MTDEPKTKTEPGRTQDSRTQSGGSSNRSSKSIAPSPSSKDTESSSLEYGDKTDDTFKRADPSKIVDKSGKGAHPSSGRRSDDDAGRNPKDPRADAPSSSSGNRTQGDRSSPANPQIKSKQPGQQNQKDLHGSSGGDCSISGKESKDKPSRS